MVVHNAYVNDACGSSSGHKSDEVENETEAKEPNVSIEKQAEIEKAAQKEEKRKKLHEKFIINTFKSICKKFKRKRQRKRPYTKCVRLRDLRRLSLYNELNKKQVFESLRYLAFQFENPFEIQFLYNGLESRFSIDSSCKKYTVKDNLSEECPLKYYLQFGIV